MPRRILLLAGNIWVGMGLLALICLYLSIVSVFTPDSMRLLGTTESGLYSHPILLTLAAMAMVSLIAAGLGRMPFRPASAGAWCGHLGLAVLAAGAIWYASARASGVAVTVRTPAGWTPMSRFYLDNTYAMYVWRDSGDQAAETPLPIRLAGRDRRQDLDVPLAGAPDRVELRVTQYLPRTRTAEEDWRNDYPVPRPGLKLRVADGMRAGKLTLYQGDDGRGHFRGANYLLVYRTEATKSPLGPLEKLSAQAGRQGTGLTAVLITGTKPPLKCEALTEAGTLWQGELTGEEPNGIEVPLARGGLHLKLEGVLTHAMCHYVIVPAGKESTDEEGRDQIVPAVEVQVRFGDMRRRLYVPYDEFGVLFDPTIVQLGDGATTRLEFTRVHRPLPRTVRMLSAEYQEYPGTRIPKDYRSELEIGSAAAASHALLSLNNPVQLGPYQLSQQSWRPAQRQHDPSHIYLGVGSRPGLWVVWLGCILISVGFPYAFYVKPLLRRRRRAQP